MSFADAHPHNKLYVTCESCSRTFRPSFGNSVWHRAYRRLTTESHDLVWVGGRRVPEPMPVSGKECGCKRVISNESDPPYRVVGFTDEFKEFDIPCESFVQAATELVYQNRRGSTVFLVGTPSSDIYYEIKYRAICV